MYLSKSDYCKGIQCEKILWLDKNKSEVKDEESNEAVLDNGKEVGMYAKGLFGSYIDIEYQEDLSKMIEATIKAIRENDTATITEASFEYDQNFCSVDILRKVGKEYEMYEVKSSTKVKDEFKEDAAYQYYILKNLGYDVKKVNIIYLNKNYVRKGDLELEKLFIIEDVTEDVKKKETLVKENINRIKSYMEQQNEPEEELDNKCNKPSRCPYFTYCTRELEHPNVFDLKGKMHFTTKIEYYKNGLISFRDLINEKLIDKCLEQIDFEINNREDKIDKEAIIEFLKTLKKELYFLDFETYQQVIPLYDGISPYEHIPFQYSLHKLDRDGNLSHSEFLAEPNIDPRRPLAEQLVNDIPVDACTVAYNMKFEKGVIKRLANTYPDLYSHLMNIHAGIKDLMIPFDLRYYYSKRFEGICSIKRILTALFPDDPTMDYHNLEGVHNGSEAMNSYAIMGTLPPEEREKLRNDLLKYCELDTYAMVKIYKKLKEVTK